MLKEEKKEFIYLDHEGYNKLLNDIEELKKDLIEVSKEKGIACSDAAGDGWHDNFAYDEACRQEYTLAGQLSDLYKRLKKVKIIEKTDDETLVEVGDIVTIDMMYSYDDIEEMKLKLVGSYGIELDAEIQEVTLESPMGKAIYHKRIGDESSYNVNGKWFDIKIKSKEKAKVLKK